LNARRNDDVVLVVNADHVPVFEQAIYHVVFGTDLRIVQCVFHSQNECSTFYDFFMEGDCSQTTCTSHFGGTYQQPVGIQAESPEAHQYLIGSPTPRFRVNELEVY
jgi:hypothetical protein